MILGLCFFAAAEWMAVSAAIGGVFVISSENGGASGPIAFGPPNLRASIRLRAQNGSENGALDHVYSQLEITRRHAFRFPPPLHLRSTFFFRYRRRRLR